MNILVRYSIRRQGTPELFDVLDEDTGTYLCDPLPRDEADALKRDLLNPPAPTPAPNSQPDPQLWAWTLPQGYPVP